jgi:hypothetical protein
VKTFNLFLSILFLFVFSSTIFATEPIPDNGLVHHLDAGQSVETDIEGGVVCRNDLSPNKRTKIIPQEHSAPQHDSWNVLNIPRYTEQVDREISTDVCVVGAGSAGCAAAIIAAREGANVVLVERQELLGGTGTSAGVAGWEPGPGCSLARELFERMKAFGGAGVGRPQPLQTKASYGYLPVTEDESYESTTHCANVVPAQFRNVPYKPEIFDQVVREMLFETKRVVLLNKTYFFQSETNSEKTRIESILVRNTEDKTIRIRAKVFIDSTGDVWVCRSLGCEVMLGIDSRNAFDEPSAPEKELLQLNAMTRIYTIAQRSNAKTQPASNPPVPFPACAYICGWKDGLLTVNMLPTLPGRVLIDYGYDEALRRSEQIVYAHWHWLQQIPDFQDFELIQIAPMLGIRESYRVKTKYVLREQDLIETLKNQQHDDIIAIADHDRDIHGAGDGQKPVSYAYGIPYRCMIPTGNWQNVLVACRGAGFSRIAASSCRLQRTMIQLGYAAGLAAAWAAAKNNSVEKIDVPALVQRLDAPKRYNEYLPPKNFYSSR